MPRAKLPFNNFKTACKQPISKAINEKIQEKSAFVDLLNMEVKKAIIGQSYMIERLLLGLLSGGHILLEGVPGLAKTLAIKSLSNSCGWQVQSDTVYTGFASGGCGGNHDIQSGEHINLPSRKDLYSPILFWQMKSTDHQPRYRVLCWKPCRRKQVTIGEENFYPRQTLPCSCYPKPY